MLRHSLLAIAVLFLPPHTAAVAAGPTDPFLASAANHSMNIDCGGAANFVSVFGRSWLFDRYFSGGAAGMVAEPHRFQQPQERTLRFFPPSSAGKKSCYSLPVPTGRYYIRTFSVYDNYDSKVRTPSFDVSVEGTLVFSYRSPWPETAARSGAYADLFSPVADAEAEICFYSLSTDAPVISSLEIAPIHPLAYDAATIGSDFLLVNYGRFTCGGSLFGPGFTNDFDAFSRVWQSDVDFRNPNLRYNALTAGGQHIFSTNRQPNYFPAILYETVTTTMGSDLFEPIEYLMPVDTRFSYMVWLHFVELDSGIGAAGQRVFDVMLAGQNITRIDIYREVGGFTAFDWVHIVENLTNNTLSIKLLPVIGRPVICGLENYAMVPLDMATVPIQVAAMRALKESLHIPARMGWNGDPCAPSAWDTWEGVTCERSNNGRGHVITRLELSSQGLNGYISDHIGNLTTLVSLNLSYNSLEGTLPPGLGHSALVSLDLSSNKFTGSIPNTIGSSNLRTVLLNNNQLGGQVPELLYSIGVHGGIIDLSVNKALCGVPTLPACPIFWDNTGLSKTGKIAIGVSSGVVLITILLVVYILCIRSGPYDYHFEFPQDLTSISAISAKRNRYHRQKMYLEMEAQNSTTML